MPCKPMTWNEQQWCDSVGGCVCVYNPHATGVLAANCYWAPKSKPGIGTKACPDIESGCYFDPCPPSSGRPCYTRPLPVACDDPRCNVGPCSGRVPYRPPPQTVPLPPPQPPSGGGSGSTGNGGTGGTSTRLCGYGPNPCSFGKSATPCPSSGMCPPRQGDFGIRVCCS